MHPLASLAFLIGGTLLTTFSDRLPDSIQEWGLWIGIFALIFGAVAFLYTEWKKRFFKGNAPSERDWNPHQAFHWAKDTKKVNQDNIFSGLTQAAADGKITIWGRKNCSNLDSSMFEHTRRLEPISKEFWIKNSLYNPRFIFDPNEDGIREATIPERGEYTNERYSDLRLSSKEVKAIRW
jgi:hypothetical protein